MQTDTTLPFSSGLLTDFRADSSPAPQDRSVALSDVPAALRVLLGQQDGMTAALERHWGEPMVLHVRRTTEVGQRLCREVVLAGASRGRPAEIGYIDIRLAALPPALAEEVRAAGRPFGALLASVGIIFRSSPQRFFQIAAGDDLADALQVPPQTLLYGRETRLTDAAGHLLAEAVEILAPVSD